MSTAYLLHKLVFALDRAADNLLRKRLNISYKRALFLLVLKHHGTVTQHELAIALGYSDPAVSTMLLELTKDGHVTIIPSPEHKRKRLVTITRQGNQLVSKGRKLLDSHFAGLMTTADVDAQHYSALTEKLQRALAGKITKRNHDHD